MLEMFREEDPGPPTRAEAARARGPRRHRVLKIFALTAAGLVLTIAGGGWMVYSSLDDNIRSDKHTADILEEFGQSRPNPSHSQAQNILLIGSDKEAGTGSERADTTMLLHLSRDRSNATLMSIPRDLLVDIPACRTSNGELSAAQKTRFNSAFQFGGAACTIRTFENLTGIRVDHHVVAEFSGFKEMVDQVGGVEMGVEQKIYDSETNITLQPGRQKLDGARALVYVRTRLGVGDGSDTQRMERQQRFMKAMRDTIMEVELATRLERAYPFLEAATSALTCDPGLDSLSKLYGLMRDTSEISEGNTRLVILPRRPAETQPDSDELVNPQARQLFYDLRNDEGSV